MAEPAPPQLRYGKSAVIISAAAFAVMLLSILLSRSLDTEEKRAAFATCAATFAVFWGWSLFMGLRVMVLQPHDQFDDIGYALVAVFLCGFEFLLLMLFIFSQGN